MGWTGKEGDYWDGLGRSDLFEVKTDRARVKQIYKCVIIFIPNVLFVHCGENAAVGCFF